MKKIKKILKLLSIRLLFDSIINYFSPKLMLKIKCKRAIKKAKMLWIATGKRHYVLFSGGQYVVLNNSAIPTLSKKLGKKITAMDLVNSATYFTPASTFHNI